MKISIRTIVTCGLIAGAAGLVATGARAGLKSTNEVTIGGVLVGTSPSQQATRASGSVGSARASADVAQYIGCEVDHQFNNSTIHGFCYAKLSSGQRVQCDVFANPGNTIAEQYIDTMRAVGPQSFISFTYLGTGTSGNCVELSIENASQFRTAAP